MFQGENAYNIGYFFVLPFCQHLTKMPMQNSHESNKIQRAFVVDNGLVKILCVPIFTILLSDNQGNHLNNSCKAQKEKSIPFLPSDFLT